MNRSLVMALSRYRTRGGGSHPSRRCLRKKFALRQEPDQDRAIGRTSLTNAVTLDRMPRAPPWSSMGNLHSCSLARVSQYEPGTSVVTKTHPRREGPRRLGSRPSGRRPYSGWTSCRSSGHPQSAWSSTAFRSHERSKGSRPSASTSSFATNLADRSAKFCSERTFGWT